MAANGETPKRELTPAAAGASPRAGTPPASSIPQKRALVEEDHTPAVRSPLNPDSRPTAKAQLQTSATDESPAMGREKRTKKESLKKRESKGVAPPGGDSSRGTPDPKQKDPSPLPAKASPLRYKLGGPLKLSDFEPTRGPSLASHHEIQGPDGETIEYFEASEQALNRKGYVYNFCIADPRFPSSLYYRQTEPAPYSAHLSFEDAAQHMYFDKTGLHVTGDLGFRMARANVGVREGRWYWECRVTRGVLRDRRAGDPESRGHVRVGWARREASRDAPVGFDAYSYGIRDVAGQKVHMSRPKEFFPPGEDVREGDVLGLEIGLPSESLHRKVVQGIYNPAVDLDDHEDERGGGICAVGGLDGDLVGSGAEAANIVRDRVPFRFKTHMIYFEKFDYHPTKELEDLMNPSPVTSSGPGGGHGFDEPYPNHPVPCLRALPNSYIKIYKNGKLMGTAYENLLAFLPPASTPNSKMQEGAREGFDDGTLGYYPAVSVFRGGAAEVNFGPDFWYPPLGFESPAPALPPAQADDDVEMIDVDAALAMSNGTSYSAAARAKVRAMAERYDEQIVEDILYDIIDEVDFWMQDGAKVIDRTGAADDRRGEPMQED